MRGAREEDARRVVRWAVGARRHGGSVRMWAGDEVLLGNAAGDRSKALLCLRRSYNQRRGGGRLEGY